MTTTHDKICEIIIEANEDEKLWVVWQEQPNWQDALDVCYRYTNATTEAEREDNDLSIIEVVFEEMLEVLKLEDTGYDSYQQLMEDYLVRN